jgi:hypothetical protein
MKNFKLLIILTLVLFFSFSFSFIALAQDFQNEASVIYKSGSNLDIILKHTGKVRNVKAQKNGMINYTNALTKGVKISLNQKYAINNFIVYGTKSTGKFSEAKRLKIIQDFKIKYKTLPINSKDWLVILTGKENNLIYNKSNWLSYKNKTAKYSLKYPSEIKIDVINDRALYFAPKSATSTVKVRMQIAFQDEFEKQKVVIKDKSSFINEVDRRLKSAVPAAAGYKVIKSETLFHEKTAIIAEIKSQSLGNSRAIFIWHGDKILEIGIPFLEPKLNNESLVNEILSTLTFF